MPEGTDPGTTDEQINAEVAVAKVVNQIADIFSIGPSDPVQAGGGGGGGRFRIASIAELDSLIGKWEGIRDKIDAARGRLEDAASAVAPPAQDQMSVRVADALVASVEKAITHNRAMREYANGYIARLTASRHAYENTETHNTSTVEHSDGA
jgi:hypothetical protein